MSLFFLDKVKNKNKTVVLGLHHRELTMLTLI